MPREVVHWMVLEKAADRVASGPCARVAECIRDNRAAAYLGAVIHDAPYYHRFCGDVFERIAGALHGEHGEDTFEPIRKAALSISNDTVKNNVVKDNAEQQLLRALLLGMVSHIATDVVFHPYIFYFTGNYHAVNAAERSRARTRHRLIEVYLDSTLGHGQKLWNKKKLSVVLAELNDNRAELSRFYETSLIPAAAQAYRATTGKELVYLRGAGDDSTFEQAVRTMSLCQQLFFSAPLGMLLRAANELTGGSLAAFDALSSFGRNKPYPALLEPAAFRNPVTGESSVTSVEQLFDEAVERCALWFCSFAPWLFGDTAKQQGDFAREVGPSLNFGVIHAPIADAKYFSETGFPLPGLF